MAIQKNLASSFQKYEFIDENEVFASFKMNPADVKLINRLQEAGKFFDNIGKTIPENGEFEDVVKLNNIIEEKICYILGYNAKDALFGLVSATSLMADGSMFVTHVLEAIKENALPEIEKRSMAMADAVAAYTAKYE